MENTTMENIMEENTIMENTTLFIMEEDIIMENITLFTIKDITMENTIMENTTLFIMEENTTTENTIMENITTENTTLFIMEDLQDQLLSKEFQKFNFHVKCMLIHIFKDSTRNITMHKQLEIGFYIEDQDYLFHTEEKDKTQFGLLLLNMLL